MKAIVNDRNKKRVRDSVITQRFVPIASTDIHKSNMSVKEEEDFAKLCKELNKKCDLK